ncbi:MAG: endolytic transglycosylase MltG [Chloroflexi bacterium]|nr:endolytic transglycosylase MltG [Chloroflexota bacterium]
MKKITVILLFLITFSLCTISALTVSRWQATIAESALLHLSSWLDSRPSTDQHPVKFVVKEGETAAAIAENLESQGLIKNRWLFRLMVKVRGVENRLEAGDYELRANMTVNEIIDRLQRGRYVGSLITFPEGWRALEMADAVERRGISSRGDFMRIVTDGRFEADFLASRPKNASLEGYLFPDTYRIPPNITPEQLVQAMLDNFGRHFTPMMRQQAADMGLTIHQVITLASIVEREARMPSERATIASVYLNRLKRGMLLQADPTVQYALVKGSSTERGSYWKKALLYKDLEVDSPYNTYRYGGLPPGPICNPGLAAIKAVLEPAQTDYLYFVAKEDGSHIFARTLEEHAQNVQKYRGAQ